MSPRHTVSHDVPFELYASAIEGWSKSMGHMRTLMAQVFEERRRAEAAEAELMAELARRDPLKASVWLKLNEDAQAPTSWRWQVGEFAKLMEGQLAANDHKGGWSMESPVTLFARLHEAAAELHDAFRFLPETSSESGADVFAEWRRKVGKEAADVANFAMMIAENCGALERSAGAN